MIPIKERIKDAENLILYVTGGIGRNIMATAVVSNLKKKFPEKKIIILANCPDIFLRNPNVKRVIPLNQPMYFYEDYILDSKSYIINAEPYQSFDYVYRNKHLVECWCDLIGIPCLDIYPEMFFTDMEVRMAQLFLEKFDKEMILIQHVGGKSPKEKNEREQIIAKSGMYRRNIPEDIIEEVAKEIYKRDYMIGSVQSETQYCIKGAEKITFPIRAILALIPHVAGIISIDSFLQHGCAVFNRMALVVWGGTNPKVLGYEKNINLVNVACKSPMCHRPNSYLFDVQPTGFAWDCPHNDVCMNHSPESIIEAFNKLTGGRHGHVKKNRGRKPENNISKRKAGKKKRKPVEGDACPEGAGTTSIRSACPVK